MEFIVAFLQDGQGLFKGVTIGQTLTKDGYGCYVVSF